MQLELNQLIVPHRHQLLLKEPQLWFILEHIKSQLKSKMSTIRRLC